MICPRCQQENPEGRGFCIRCAYPLPEERRQEQTPAYEPINFDAPAPVRTAEPLQGKQSSRKRPVVLGIVGLIMGILALEMAFFGVMCAASEDFAFGLFSVYSYEPIDYIDADQIAGIFGITFAIFSAVFGLLATIFGSKAKNRQSAEPERYMGKGMYVTALILGVVSLVICTITLIIAVSLLK